MNTTIERTLQRMRRPPVCDMHVRRRGESFTIDPDANSGVWSQIQGVISATHALRSAFRELCAHPVPGHCFPQWTPAGCRNYSSESNSWRMFSLRHETHFPLHMDTNSASINPMLDMCEKASCTFRRSQFHHRPLPYARADSCFIMLTTPDSDLLMESFTARNQSVSKETLMDTLIWTTECSMSWGLYC